MRTPPLTIALLTYNRSHYLKESLAAILAQTYTDFELLVMDNGSTDDTAEVALACRDPRLTYVRLPGGNGPEFNSASASWFARGNRFLCTHDDDILEPEAVARQMAWMDADPRIKAVATNASVINEFGEPVQPRIRAFKEDILFEKGEYLEFFLREKFAFPLSSLMVDTRNFGRNASKRYYESIKPQEVFLAGDILFFCLLNAMGPLAFISDPLLRYRLHQDQSSKEMHLVKPELDLMLMLERNARRSRVFGKYLNTIKASVLRCHGNYSILEAKRREDLPLVTRQVQAIQRKWAKAVPARGRVQDAALPFEIMALLLGLDTVLPPSAATVDRWPVLDDPCRLAFRAWYRRALNGEPLFRGPRKPRRIAVLGSAQVAFLIVLEAFRAGVEVVCCLDSKRSRQGEEQVLGLPVYPHEWLAEHHGEIDAVVLSTEGRYGDWIRSLVRRHLDPVAMPIPSWKEFLLGAKGR